MSRDQDRFGRHRVYTSRGRGFDLVKIGGDEVFAADEDPVEKGDSIFEVVVADVRVVESLSVDESHVDGCLRSRDPRKENK